MVYDNSEGLSISRGRNWNKGNLKDSDKLEYSISASSITRLVTSRMIILSGRAMMTLGNTWLPYRIMRMQVL